MLTIKRAAALTGVSVDTLRAWERRYRVIAPRRTESGYRLYDEEALDRIVMMRTLVDSGWSPRQAADRVRAGGFPTSDAVPASAPLAGASPADSFLADSSPGDSSPGPPLDGLARAAADFDADRTDRLLDQALAHASFEQAVDDWLMPALVRLGSAWERGEVDVAGEHLVSATVQRRLAAAFDAAGQAVGAPRVVVGLPQGSRHELGVLAFATSARRCGLDVTYLGADLPVAAWADAAVTSTASAVVLGVPTAEDADLAAATVSAVVERRPGTRVFTGGAAQDLVTPTARPLGHRVGVGARRLAEVLGSPAEAVSA